MRIKSFWLIGIFAALLSNNVTAEQRQCEDVYAGSVRDINIDIKTLMEKNDIYSMHCEANGSLKQSSASVDLTVPVQQGVNVGFKGSKADAQQEMQNFCKEYKQAYSKSQALYKLSNTVVVDALNRYNQCKALEINKVQISHVATQSRTVSVQVSFNPAVTIVDLQGISYDTKVATCRTDAFGQNAQVVSFETGSVLVKKPFSITCERIAEETANRGKKYPHFELGIATGAGPYTVNMPVEEVLGYDLASKNKVEIENAAVQNDILTTQNNSLASKIVALNTQMNNINIEAYFATVGDGSNVECPQRGGNLQAHIASVCAGRKSSPPVARGGNPGGGTCGWQLYTFTCYTYP
jgi:hypothetical protein